MSLPDRVGTPTSEIMAVYDYPAQQASAGHPRCEGAYRAGYKVVFDEPVAGARGLQFVVGQDLECQVEAARELVLPLLGEAAGADDETAPRSPRAISSLMSSPAMIVLLAPGSSARRKRSGCRGS